MKICIPVSTLSASNEINNLGAYGAILSFCLFLFPMKVWVLKMEGNFRNNFGLSFSCFILQGYLDFEMKNN